MKKILVCFSLFLSVFILFPNSVYAATNKLEEINISVVLDEYGNAYIRETWTGKFPDNTENYKVMENLKNEKLKDFKVSSNPYIGDFKEVTPWDTDKNRKEKTLKYGLVTKSTGYELCWGIGGFDGLVSFDVEYRIENFVKQYEDGIQGFNWQFVSVDMNPAPKNVNITISLENGLFNLDTTDIWAFGFGGEIYNKNGVISAYTTETFRNSDYFTILFGVPENTFNIETIQNESFEDVRELALQDSDYNENDSIDSSTALATLLSGVISIFMFIISVILFILPIIFIGLFSKFIIRITNGISNIKNMPNEQKDDIPYHREIPFDNNLGLGYVTKKFITSNENYEDLISAYFLKWVKEGYLTVVEGLYKNDEKVALRLESDKIDSCFDFENKLYAMVVSASGKDKLLHEYAFNSWAEKNYKYLGNVLNGYFKKSKNLFKEKGYLEEKAMNGVLTDLGKEEVKKYIGFKKYLKDYSLINERSIKEVNLWEDYLIWATLYGIASVVEKQLDIVDPTYFENLDVINMRQAMVVSKRISSTGMRGYYTSVERQRVASSSSSSSRSSGGGGSSSRSGGGGSSGGGRGGGSR